MGRGAKNGDQQRRCGAGATPENRKDGNKCGGLPTNPGCGPHISSVLRCQGYFWTSVRRLRLAIIDGGGLTAQQAQVRRGSQNRDGAIVARESPGEYLGSFSPILRALRSLLA